ncbi:MAG: hypothetical protein K6A78_10480 [Prevotella sp.]|nr:hypothetical protein [Prevotella sp.]
MNIKLLESVVNILIAVLNLLIERYQKDELDTKADHTLAEAVRNSHIGMTDEEILDRI